MKRNVRKFNTYAPAFIMLVAFLLVMTSAPVFGQAEDASSGAPVNGALADKGLTPKSGGIDRLQADTGGKAQVSVSSATGKANFIRLPEGAALSLTRGGSARAEAAAFFARYGGAFGISDANRELTLVRQRTDDLGMTHLTYQQVYDGVNVFAGRMDVHLGKGNRITAVNGAFIPKINLRTTPDLSVADASAAAVGAVLAQQGMRGDVSTDIAAVRSELYVYQDGLTQGLPGRVRLVYDVEVANPAGSVREFVFVDAHTGQIINQVTGIHEGLSINVYNGGYGPGFLVWSTGDPYPYTNPGDPQAEIDINNLIDGTTESYYNFFNAFGRDSYDDLGHVMETVNNDPAISCPNANWNGTSTNYCTDVTGDDTVAHEWGHAYTEYTSNLIYQWQSGALNESYSDIWGEVVDLTNGRGLDTPGGPRTDGACSLYTPASPLLTVNAPVGIAGDYVAGPAQFGPPIDGTLTGDVMIVDDGSAAPTEGCNPLINDLTGKIAFIRRGTCAFTTKVLNAQNAGAIGAIVANHATGGDGVITMAGTEPLITIQSLFIGFTDGNTVEAEILGGSTVNVTFNLDVPVTPDDSYRWLSGEDDPAFGGAIRDMWTPTCYGDPGKVTDAEYMCGTSDSGGVHTNSGVPNHAFALMVDGGTYNGYSGPGIGLTKAAHIHWRAQSVYEGPATNFAGHADALEASCTDLIGVNLEGLSPFSTPAGPSGEIISAADCAEVAAINAAVEFRTDPTTQCGFTPMLDPNAPPLCDGLGAVETISLTDWEAGLGSWTVGVRDQANPATFSTPDWAVVGSLPDGRAGQAAFVEDGVYGDCAADTEAGVLFLESPPIVIPVTSEVPRVAFDHWVATELGWDGGNVKISLDGGLTWSVIPGTAYEFNTYPGTLNASDNPMGGEEAFTGTDGGSVGGSWGQSQINLLGIAAPGDTIILRFEMGLDGCNGVVGWYVDDVQAYSCADETPPVFVCGDGILDPGETCDDGNTANGDGCSDTCQVEDGWTCTDPTTGGNAVPNGDFEAGPVDWTESSTGGWGLIGEWGVPSDGTWHVWLGGVAGYEEAFISQSVAIPSTATTMDFDWFAGVCDSTDDYLDVRVDGGSVFNFACSAPGAGYVTESVDISAFADDAPHDLQFYSESFGTNGTHSNFFVDAVVIPTPGAASVCTPIPTGPFACNSGAEGFEAGIPVDWAVVDNAGNGLVWSDIAGAGELGNYTNGSGDAATVSSDAFGPAGFDTEMRTPSFSLATATAASLDFTANYQNFGFLDFLEVDISIDGGATWTNLMSWNEDHGSFRAPPGEDVSIDLAAYLGESNVMLRFRYYDPNGAGAWDWYAQVDDVALNCVVPSTLTCNAAPVNFDSGIPAEWTVVDNEGNGVVWSDIATSGEAGNFTGGGGDAASVSSDVFGPAGFDTELISDPFDLPAGEPAALNYLVNYQNFGFLDFLDVDISSDGGATWTNLLSWNEDHGAFRAAPGETVSIDLSAYAGMTGLQLRWRYYDPNPGSDWDWYAQVDDVGITCGAPEIDVAPGSLASTQRPDVQVTESLSISNLGSADLDWNIEEAATTPLLPIAPAKLAGTSDSAAKAAANRVTIGDADISARGAGTGERVTPQGAGEFPSLLTTITHSLSQSIVSFNSVSCNDGVGHTDNSYLRVFDLASFGITDSFDVVEVQIGIETALSGAGGSQPMDVNLYTMIDPLAPLTFGNLLLIGSASTMVVDQDLTLLTIPVAGTAPAGSVLVVEIFTPNGQADGNLFFIGSNPDGQTAPSYLAAAACGLPEPLDVAAIGFPGMHIVMNVTGDTTPPTGCVAPTDLPWVSVAPNNGLTPPAATDYVDVTFDSTGLTPGAYSGTLCVNSNDPATPLVEVPVEMTVEDTILYVSSNSGNTAGGVWYHDEDIMAYNTDTGVWSLYFDGTDVGVKRTDVDALHVLDDGSILMSFEQRIKIPGLGKVDDSDIVKFIPTSLGENTAGSFEMFFDASDVGLKKAGEDVDAIGFTPDGRLVVSTLAAFKVPQTGGGRLRGADDDLIVFNEPSGDWEMYFDGSDVWHYTEDMWGVWPDSATGDIFISLQNAFTAGAISGDELDVFVCHPISLGADTACDFEMFFDGSVEGFGGDRIDGFSIGFE